MIEGETGGRDVVLDLEAGLESMSRGTPRYVDTMIAIIEPYFRSLEAGRRVVDLARELDVSRVLAAGNKVRNDADREAIAAFCESHEIDVAAWLPYDDGLLDAERQGKAPVDYDSDSPAVTAIRGLAETLIS